jgi:hypothetical protein
MERIISKYLDLQDFVVFENDRSVYFVNSKVDRYSQIRFDRDDLWLGMADDLCTEISSFFSLDKDESRKIIGLWVKNKFKIRKPLVVQSYFNNKAPVLMVPY